MKYGVFDGTGSLVRIFNTRERAETFKIYACRPDWKVKQINK